MKIKTTMALVALLAISVLFTYPQNAGTKTLTLQEAINTALENNTSLKQSETAITSAGIDVKQKKYNFLPDVGFTITASANRGKEYDPVTGDYNKQSYETFSIKKSASLNIFNGFYDMASLKQSIIQLKAAEQNVSRSRQTIVFETIQRFFIVVTSEEAVKVEEENLETQKLQLQRIDDFCKAGRRPITDLHQQKAEIAQAEYRLLDAKRNLEVNKLLLLESIGVLKPGGAALLNGSRASQSTQGNASVTTVNPLSGFSMGANGSGLQKKMAIEVASPNIDQLTGSVVEFNKRKEIKEAFMNRPDVKAAKMDIMAAQSGVKAAKSGYYPTLDLFTEVGTNYTSMLDYSNFSDQLFDGNLYGKVGLSLSIPVFDKGRTKNNVALARVNQKSKELVMEKLISQVIVEMTQAMEDYNTAAKQVEVAASQQEYISAALESVRERYNVNAATMIELTQMQAQHLEAVYDSIQAKYNLLIQGVALSFYKGDENAMMSMMSVLEKNKS